MRQCRAACASFAAASLLASTTLNTALAADAGTLLSPAALTRGTNGVSPSSSVPAPLASPALQAQIALSAANLARAAKDLSTLAAAQAAASASSQLTLGNASLSGSSWNGTALSGLNPRDSDPTLWINADALKKDTASATATVKQTAANALLTWQSFDLNKGEKLVFDQQGNADWNVLNRVVAGPRDASGSRFVASPSVILGTIEAPGSVYVINPNGVVFGPTAQINVHSLIASSLDVGSPSMPIAERNSFFLNTGILGNGSNVPAESFSYNPADRVIEGDVTVQAGAKITANPAPRALSPDAGGFVYLFAPNVENRGAISTPAGETLMVAAQAVQLIANTYTDIFGDATPASFRAVGINTQTGLATIGNLQVTADPIIWRLDGPAAAQISAPGKVTNSGSISADRGVVILNGDLVTNGSSGGSGPGVIQANTSITRNGQIYLDARLKLTLDGGSLQILPTENGETIPDSALDKFAPGAIEMRGVTVDMEPGALIEAPGAKVSILAAAPPFLSLYPDSVASSLLSQFPQRIYMAADATIDVSGLQGVERPMSDNFLTFKPFGNEFADQPLQRDGALRGLELTVDLRQSGALNGANWIGTPLANLSGYATSVPRTIDQLLTTGGKVSLTASSDGDIVLRQNSAINVGGGTVQYAASNIAASRLLMADGHIVSISRADPLETYVGVAGLSILEHPKWGDTTTETFGVPLLAGAALEPGYIEGHDAGAITISGAATYVLDGDLYGGVIAGERQRALGQRPSAKDNALAMPQAASFSITGVNNLTIGANPTVIAGNFSATTPLSKSVLQTATLPAQKLSDGGFGSISASVAGKLTVTSDATLTAAPGGTISLSGGSVDIEGSLIAHSGSITVDSTAQIAGDQPGTTNYVPTAPNRPDLFDLIVGPAVRLDVSGLWVNDGGADPADLVGSAFIDGGSVTLKTEARTAGCLATACTTLQGLGAGVPALVDLTGDIVLNQGASLDVSSGGRITDRGLFMLDSMGRAAGKGGNISLATYAGGFQVTTQPFPPTVTNLSATIRLAGSDGSPDGNAAFLASALKSYGFSQGGTLNLQAPAFDIGNAASPGAVALPASFFDGNGFGAYSFTSVAGHLAVAPDTRLALRQRNFMTGDSLATLPTGAKVSGIAGIGFLSDFLRQPVNLTLSSQLPLISAAPYDPVAPVPSKMALSIGAGASLLGDPGAKITINVAGHDSFEGAAGGSGGFASPVSAQTAGAEILGSISAPGGRITLAANGFAQLWLGAESRLDVSGVALIDDRQTLFRTGTVMSGGSVTIAATPLNGTDTQTAVIGLHGAQIEASGAAAEFDLLADSQSDLQSGRLGGLQFTATQIWSDAGSITLSAPTLLYDGSFTARAGSSEGNGGSLTIAQPVTGGTPGNERVTVLQSGDAVPAGLNPIAPLGALTGSAVFFAGRLGGSGIQTLSFNLGPGTGDTVGSGQSTYNPGTLAFSGNVTLTGLDQLLVDASQIALTNTVAATDSSGCNVCLGAGYVALRGAGNANRLFPKAGTGVLQVSAGMIDIAAGGFTDPDQLSLLSITGAAKTSFISRGDIRLRAPLTNVSVDVTPGTIPYGELVSAGDLTFKAAQIYPVSNFAFTLKSIAPKGTIAFAANGPAQSPPLTAGGQITVSAARIDQSGVLLAPLGTIRLGAQTKADLAPNDPTSGTVIPTQSVHFGAGSVTSVSLNGQNVPFGQTANGTSWSYDSVFGQPLTAPPVKNLLVNAAAIDLGQGATLDLSGGGDIQAIEFVPGTGGTRDVLSGANVYAVIPGYNPAAVPVDSDFILQRHDALPAVGSSVFLSGEAGLAAGFYTLLPAHYATLPGAYRVALVSNSSDALARLNSTLPDGTLRVAGYFANSLSASRDARLQYFDVQSSAVWRRYSEIDQTSGNNFFASKPSAAGIVPQLPVDAGHGALNGLTAINLQGRVLSAPAANGRGSEFDIAAQDIQILSPGAKASDGYVGLDATQLSDLGVDSLLLGGIRSQASDGEYVSVVANSVTVSNDASAPLQGPEVILVTRVAGNSVDPNGSRGLTLDAGSVVQANGAVVNPAQKKLIIGSDAQQINGNGNLLAVSNGSVLDVERQRVAQNNGVINLAGSAKGVAGATVRGNSITLDTSGNIRPGTGATLSAANMAISVKSINFGTPITRPPNQVGLNIDSNFVTQLLGVSNLSLRSLRTIDFNGPVDFSLGAGSHLVLDTSALVSVGGTKTGAVRLGANEITWLNSGTWDNPKAVGSAALTLTASQIDIGAGAKTLSGFGSVAMSAASLITLRDNGSFDAGAAALAITTPLLLVGSKANQSIATAADVTLAGTGGAAPATAGEVGGTFAMTGRTITLTGGADVRATAGGVSLTATAGGVPSGASAITLGANTRIEANGFVSTFFDVTEAVGGGAVQLAANQGSIDIDPTARIDISSPAGLPGYAGQVALAAPNGSILSQGKAFDMGTIAGNVAGDHGGRLILDAQSLGTSLLALPGIFDDAVDVHLRQGDVELASDIKAATITLTVDGGILRVARSIDASGAKGGSISLFGGNGVAIAPEARLLATASDASKRGGDILIGTQGPGVLDLQGGLIDVSNTANAANGGTVRLRAPLTGAAFDDVAINPVGTAIQGARSVTVEGYRVFDTHNSAFNGVIDPLAQPSFYGSCNNQGVCSGTLIGFVQKFALSAAAQAKFAAIPSTVLHLQPGIELVNNDLAINGGDITVGNAWNLGSGLAGFLVSAADYAPKNKPAVPAGTIMTDANGNLLPQYAGYKGDLLFVPGVSQIHTLFYRVGGSVTGEAAVLTLRAAGDVAINDSITDGFFNTRNVFDPNYMKNLSAWINTVYSSGASSTDVSNVGGYIIAGATVGIAHPMPLAPYDAKANGISPDFSGQDKSPISGADLFPLIPDPSGPIQDAAGTRYSAVNSSSYRIVAGADTASANPLAVKPLSVFDPVGTSPLAGSGNVVMNGHRRYQVSYVNPDGSLTNAAYATPTMVRTGTGSIDIAAGLDFVLADKTAPGVVYTAGRNSVDLPDPGFVVQNIADPLDSTQTIAMPVATNPEGFLKPQPLYCSMDLSFGCNPYGPLTQAAYPVAGGRLTLTAQRDIIGYEHPTLATPYGPAANQQYFAPWLLAQGTALTSPSFGAFAPLSGYLATGQLFTPSQTSWWINFGSFDQGLMSVGGDVTVKAGRDIQELSVSLPTTMRVSGGLSSTITDAKGNTIANIPVAHLNGSGDMTVVAGRDIKSGAYYEGSGDARILTGGSVSASWESRVDPGDATITSPVSTVLAVDTGRIALQARGGIDIAGIVSGPSLQNVANADNASPFDLIAQSVSGYGQSSAVSLLSASGDVVMNDLPWGALTFNGLQIQVPKDTSGYPDIGNYPASFRAVAANGDINVKRGFRLAASEDGTLELLAHGSLLTSVDARDPFASQPISTGPSLVEAVFDAVNPLAGFAPDLGSPYADLGALLLHQGDSAPDRFYAATGDIVATGDSNPQAVKIAPLAWEITKPAKVQAARDIIDLSFFGQNLAPADITSVTAGRDIFYTGAWQTQLASHAGVPDLKVLQNLGGLSLAGPGFFLVQAGRNLGPFVTAAADIVAAATTINNPIGTGIVTFGNTVVVGNRRSFASGNPSAADPFALGANNALERRGADIVALFGVANGIDYASVIRNYVDPKTSTSQRDYIPALQTYLQTLGLGAMSPANAWTAFTALPAGLQEIFADKVFLSEIKLPGNPDGCCYKDYPVAYSMINTLFPASLGYTDNRVTGSAAPVLRATGNVDLLHATIKTLQSTGTNIVNADGSSSVLQVGGDILLFGPGGSINVGTTALEVNQNLSNSSLGILTLNNGAINVFTDANVLVNQSRVLTVQGGDIMLFSSNGNLDAGRGAKTTVDFKPLSVIFDPADLQTINLNGLVSGAGIGTIRSTPDAPAASAALIAPRGIVNAGDAGLRSSGNLDIVALLVLNAANVAFAGTSSGLPGTSSVNLGALESTSSTGGQAARIADDSVAAAASRGAQTGVRSLPSLVTVEVLGFGDCDPESGRACAAN